MHGVGAPVKLHPESAWPPPWEGTGQRPFPSGGPYLTPSGMGGRRRQSCSAKGRSGNVLRFGRRSLCQALWWGRGTGDSTGAAGLRARNLATLKFESHLIFMCYEILILALIFFNHFNL